MNNKIKARFGIRQMAEDKETVEIYIYGDITAGYYDWWDDKYYEDNSAERIKNELGKYQNVKTINLYINSFGGEVFEGTAIANQLRRHQAEVHVVIDGFACSIASVIAVSGDKVSMPANAVMMVHNMWTVTMGNANELRKTADDLDVLMEANKTIYLEKAGGKLDYETLTELMNNESYLTAAECLQYGLCDEIIDNAKLDNNLLTYQEKNLEMRLKKLQAHSQLIDELTIFDEEEEENEENNMVKGPKNYLQSFFE